RGAGLPAGRADAPPAPERRVFSGGALPAGGGRRLSAAAGGVGALPGPAGPVLRLPAGVQRLFHLRRHPDPEPHPRRPDGQGDVLRLYPVHVRPAPGAARLRFSVRPSGAPVGPAAQRAAPVRRGGAVGRVLPPDGSGCDRLLTPPGCGIIIEPEKQKTPGELVWTG